MARVTSEVFESQKDIWGVGQYPLRVRIDFPSEWTMQTKHLIPLSAIFGIHGKGHVEIEPYFRNVSIAELSSSQFEVLRDLFLSTTNEIEQEK